MRNVIQIANYRAEAERQLAEANARRISEKAVELLSEFSAEQIILALFSVATEPEDLKVLQPSAFPLIKKHNV